MLPIKLEFVIKLEIGTTSTQIHHKNATDTYGMYKPFGKYYRTITTFTVVTITFSMHDTRGDILKFSK